MSNNLLKNSTLCDVLVKLVKVHGHILLKESVITDNLKMIILTVILLTTSTYALEVIYPDFKDEINLTIVRARPDGLNTYSLTNINSRKMDLACDNNRFDKENDKSFIRYRNFYNVEVADFIIPDRRACHRLKDFIEAVHYGIDIDSPIKIKLSRKSKRVTHIIYPNLDPFADYGDVMDLFKKPDIIMKIPREQPKAPSSNSLSYAPN